MTWRSRRRGVFEALPRAVHRRAGARYLAACAVGMVVNGVVVAGFGVVVVALFLDLRLGELALFGLCSAVGYTVESLAAVSHFRRVCAPVRAWFAGGAAPPAWSAAAVAPLALVRRWPLYAIGALGSAGAGLRGAR